MDKRYQVFVSSTYQDLTEERAAVIQAILNLDHLPAGMEMFPAANEDQWTLIQRVIDESDYYVVVVAGRYGSVSAEGISYTEKEYDYAVDTGTPILGFVHAEPDNIPVGKTDKDDEKRRKLAEFRAKVETRMVKHFASAADLGGYVTTGLVHAIKYNPGVGWVRGDQAMTIETERELSGLRERLAKAEKELQQAKQAMVEDPSTLAQGGDELRVPVYLAKLDGRRISHATYDVATTWDELFADIGPIMVGEGHERAVRLQVGLHLASREPGAKRNEMTEDNITDDDWRKIELQYRALGLIELGRRRREASDYGKYLRLTDRGDRHLIHLRAIQRPTQTN